MTEIDRKSVTANEPQGAGYAMSLSNFFGLTAIDAQNPHGAICTTMPKLDPSKRWTQRRDIALRDTILYSEQWANAVELAANKFAAHGGEVHSKYDSRLQMASELIFNIPGGYHSMLKAARYTNLLTGNNVIIEIVRDTPTQPARQINLLNTHQCERTGNPDAPIRYHTINGKPVDMPWYNVFMFDDQRGRPFANYGTCAAQRVYASVHREAILSQRQLEIDSGSTFHKLIVMSGKITESIDDIQDQANLKARNQGKFYEKGAVVVPALSEQGAQIAEVDLLRPQDPEEIKQRRMELDLIYANAVQIKPHELNPDNQTLAGLNSGGQRNAEDEQADIGGVAYLRGRFEEAFTRFVFPAGTTFTMQVPSLSAQMKLEEAKRQRAETRAVMVATGEITPDEARNIAGDAGDIPAEFNQPDRTDGGVMDENDKE